MIKRLLLAACAAALIASCNEESGFKKAEDAQDAGREFIRATLDGNYEKAKFYMLKDEDNLWMLDNWKKIYDRFPADSVRQFKNANIRPIKIEALNDSTTLYTYSNSFTKDTTSVKVVRINKEWVVDLKTFIGE
ncbi:MAG TPA: hypothetical protein VD993_07430 [Chitinophagaceae bacterium]|nr:hypothetical protein [Chitinophagaceae bacterium]